MRKTLNIDTKTDLFDAQRKLKNEMENFKKLFVYFQSTDIFIIYLIITSQNIFCKK